MRALNGFVTRRLLRLTAPRNVDSERVGFVNRAAARVYRAREALERFKKRGQRRYYAIKYLVFLAFLYGIVRLATL